ncbi:hypothetical protein BLS_005187 [Venturia inaequalis]|uniref:Uncharacterized protein n=1 Tax=Venturia inaequalis TaxID=5025 RepID=A0A8H3UGR8_VENIN|nr:hypothetical protein BLS_005187 [Venturia inaequalis]
MEPQRPREQASCDVQDHVGLLSFSFIDNTEPERTAEDKLLMTGSSLNTSSPTAASISLHRTAMMDASHFDSDSSDPESDSETELNTPLTGIKALSAVRTSTHSPPGPLPSQSSAQRPRAFSFVPAPLIGHKLDDVTLSSPPSLAAMDGDENEWDFADTRDDNSAEEGFDGWENIDSSVFDLATGTMKDSPTTVYENENFRQTATKFMEMYTEKYTPSPDTQRKFYKAMETLRFVGEFGYECVKEPLIDWADIVAVKMLDMPLDEASSQLRNDLLSYLPERLLLSSRGAASTRSDLMMTFPNDLSAIDNVARELMKMNVNPMQKDELELQTVPSRDKEKKATTGVKIIQEKPLELKSAPVKPPIDPEAEERRRSFKLEMTGITRMRALEDQKRAAQRGPSRKEPDPVNDQTKSLPQISPSKTSLKSWSLAPQPKLVSKTTIIGQISPPRINRTAASQSMASRPEPVSRGRMTRVATTGPQPPTPTNHTVFSEPIRSSTKTTQTTQCIGAARTTAINASTGWVSHPVVAPPAAATSAFSSPLGQVTSSTRRLITLSETDISFMSDEFYSPYGDDAEEDSDEEL